MVKAVLRLILITVGFLILAVFAVLSIRWVGLQQGFQPPSHPWFQKPFWWVYTPAPEGLCQDVNLATTLPNPDWIVTIPVRRHEQDWQIPCAKPILLSDFLNRTDHKDFMLKVLTHDTWALDKLVEIVSAHDGKMRFAVVTDSQKASMFLRKRAPQWLFAADQASILRLRMFESLWIETAMDFWPDFVISSFAPQDDFHIDARMAAEVDRRKKRILLNWNENTSQEPPVPIDGVMTNRPSAAQQKFSPRL